MPTVITKDHIIIGLVCIILGAGGSSAAGFTSVLGGGQTTELKKELEKLRSNIQSYGDVAAQLKALNRSAGESREQDARFKSEMRRRLNSILERLRAVEFEAMLARGEKLPLGPRTTDQ